jgi:hypothetical protein
MTEKTIEPVSEGVTSSGDLDNPLVIEFIELKEKWEQHKIRVDKMEQIDRDYEVLEGLHDDLTTRSAPEMKSSMMFFAMNSFDSDIVDLPKVKPSGTTMRATDRNLLDSLREQLSEDVGMTEVWADILYGFKAEGSSVVQIGFDEDDTISLDKADMKELFFDPRMPKLAGKNVRRGKTAKTVVRAVKMKFAEFRDQFPDHADQVLPGNPSSGLASLRDNSTVFSKDDLQLEEDMYVYYCYSVQDSKNPIKLVFAGSNAVIIEEERGSDYKFKEVLSNGKERAYLPFIDFHFSNVRRGFYSMSIIGILNDISEVYRKALKAALPVFHKSVNPLIMLFGAVDDRIHEEIQIAQELQSLGETPLIPVGQENVQMQSITPEGGIFDTFERLRNTVLRDATSRFKINFQELEDVEQTATEFVGKTKATAVAKTAIYRLNRRPIERIFKYIVQLAISYWDSDDKRLIRFDLDETGDVQEELPMGLVLTALKDISFEFTAEVDIRVPMSTQDKDSAMKEMEGSVQNLFYSIPYQSTDEISMEIDGLYNRAVFRELDHIYTKKKLMEKAQLILDARTQATVEAQAVEGGGQQGPANEDIARELAPQSFLKEANLDQVAA